MQTQKGGVIMKVTRPKADSFRDALLAAFPHVRAFALCLCRDAQRAEDLVEEALVKGWQARESFEEGTNLKAWLFTIVRNNYFSELRTKNQALVEADGEWVERLSQVPAQSGPLDLHDFVAALGQLEPAQREALILIGRRASPMRRPPKSAVVRSDRSRAASIARATVSPSCSRFQWRKSTDVPRLRVHHHADTTRVPAQVTEHRLLADRL
jgi:RNA polymerase sigma factor (sigma-70 family)